MPNKSAQQWRKFKPYPASLFTSLTLYLAAMPCSCFDNGDLLRLTLNDIDALLNLYLSKRVPHFYHVILRTPYVPGQYREFYKKLHASCSCGEVTHLLLEFTDAMQVNSFSSQLSQRFLIRLSNKYHLVNTKMLCMTTAVTSELPCSTHTALEAPLVFCTSECAALFRQNFLSYVFYAK